METILLSFMVLYFCNLVLDYPLQGAFLAEWKCKNNYILFVHSAIWGLGVIHYACVHRHIRLVEGDYACGRSLSYRLLEMQGIVQEISQVFRHDKFLHRPDVACCADSCLPDLEE